MKLFFAWYDIWIGVYVDRKAKRLYVCPLPCCVVQINLPCEVRCDMCDMPLTNPDDLRRWKRVKCRTCDNCIPF